MKYKFTITGIDCPNCAAKLAAMIEECELVDSAKINFLTERLVIESERTADEVLECARKTAKRFSSDVEIEK